jgi:hypothetical protein
MGTAGQSGYNQQMGATNMGPKATPIQSTQYTGQSMAVGGHSGVAYI